MSDAIAPAEVALLRVRARISYLRKTAGLRQLAQDLEDLIEGRVDEQLNPIESENRSDDKDVRGPR